MGAIFRLLVSGILLSGISGLIFPSAVLAQQKPAEKFIQDLGDHAVAVIADKSLTEEQRSNQYHRILQDSFDMPAIGRFALGRYWNTATPEQQQEYSKLFDDMTVKIYGDRLDFYKGERFRVKSMRQEGDNDYIVSSEVVHPAGSPPTAIDWRVRNRNNKLLVIDVLIENVSQSLTQRQEYASVIERHEGSIESLLDVMRQRLQRTSTADAGRSN
ncbi:MAG: ABC transporter substrate-binding protein [Alphaproteobacteria bacterium]